MDIYRCEKRFGKEKRKQYEERKKAAEAKSAEKHAEFLSLTEAAKQGDAVAQYKLGKFYSYKGGLYQVEQDLSTASEWFHKSADQGYSEAQFALGLMYETGTGGNPKNINMAEDLYKRAAAQGHSAAKWRLSEDERAERAAEETRKQYIKGGAFLLFCYNAFTIWLCLQ